MKTVEKNQIIHQKVVATKANKKHMDIEVFQCQRFWTKITPGPIVWLNLDKGFISKTFSISPRTSESLSTPLWGTLYMHYISWN